MQRPTIPSVLAQPFCPVKYPPSSQPGVDKNPVRHHKSPLSIDKPIIVSYYQLKTRPYGVSSSRRVLTPGLFVKRFDDIRDCLKNVIGLTVAQREVALRLLRLWAYYGYVYPKASQVCELPGCSKATYWRTLKTLREMALVLVINRYVIRPHAQISNLYRLDRLVLLIARYLAERGVSFWQKWLAQIFAMPGQQFWSEIFRAQGDRAGPGLGA